jgi:hypothetical protein
MALDPCAPLYPHGAVLEYQRLPDQPCHNPATAATEIGTSREQACWVVGSRSPHCGGLRQSRGWRSLWINGHPEGRAGVVPVKHRDAHKHHGGQLRRADAPHTACDSAANACWGGPGQRGVTMHTGRSITYPASITAYVLRGLLVCATAGCGQRLEPLQLAGQPRGYLGPCGCRLTPVDAAAVEQCVYDALVRRDPALEDAEPGLRYATYRALRFEVAVGATPDELMFIWRTGPPNTSGAVLT